MASPKPVITHFGESHLVTAVLEKKLQHRMKSLQLDTPAREDGSLAFSSVCEGVEFCELRALLSGQVPPYSQPALHTFWTECWQTETYQSRIRPHIESWLQQTEQLGGSGEGGGGGGGRAECLIVYCITPEVRAKRQRSFTNPTPSHVEESMKTDFRAIEVFQLRLASSEEGRVLDSLQTFSAKLNSLCRGRFQKYIESEAESVAKERCKRVEPKDLYRGFLKRLNLAIMYEMTLHNDEALQLYQEAAGDLEAAISSFFHSKCRPEWLKTLCSVDCSSWDYPKLVWHHLAWQYLPAIQRGSSHLLHIHTFLLVRLSHLLFQLEQAWDVSDLCIATLHCMARQMKLLQLPLTDGAYDCWAYMTCNEAVLAIMSRVNPDRLVDSTTSLLLVRAELWHYALDKLHVIGGQCGLMPHSNALNRDNVLITKLSNGIHPVPFKVSSKEMMEDQGAKLRQILISKDFFKEAYLILGEMVIGAFKHAGRRRMAFRVGTKMAKFHCELGMLLEAEELLSDICRFYSEDRWLELSSPSYGLLADCQRKLGMEDQHVNTLLLLAALPEYPPAQHSPDQWMTQLMSVADKSPYQKILNWHPLLELERVEVVRMEGREGSGGGGGRGGGEMRVGDTLTLAVTIKSLAPKSMKRVIMVVTLLTRHTPSPDHKPSPPHPSSFSFTEQPLPPLSPSAPSSSSLLSLENLDLDQDSFQLSHSRPIGHITKARTNTTTYISSSSLLGKEGREQKAKLLLTANLATLPPGNSRVTVSGKVAMAGRYYIEKISLKCGALDFVTSATSGCGWGKEPLVALEKEEDITVFLLPKTGIFLAGYPQECTLTFETGSDTTIPQDAAVSIVTSSDVIASSDGSTQSKAPCDTTPPLSLSLPSLPSSSSHSLPLTLTFPSLQSPLPSPRMEEEGRGYVWRHQLVVRCGWIVPSHEAILLVDVHQPLTISYCEHSAGESTFLQVSLENTCPVPLLLRDHTLSTNISTTQLHSSLPEILGSADSFSGLWKTSPGTTAIGEMEQARFTLQFKPQIYQQDTVYVDVAYSFPLSNMKTLFHTQLFTKPLHSHPCLQAGYPAQLKFIAYATSRGKLPHRLYYTVTALSSDWDLWDSPNGTVDTPDPIKSIQICIRAVPVRIGQLSTPKLTLKVPLTAGSEVAAADSHPTRLVPLTAAQVHELSPGETVTVAGYVS